MIFFSKKPVLLDDTQDQKTRIELLHRTDIRRPLHRWLRDNVENAQERSHSYDTLSILGVGHILRRQNFGIFGPLTPSL